MFGCAVGLSGLMNGMSIPAANLVAAVQPAHVRCKIAEKIYLLVLLVIHHGPPPENSNALTL